MISLQQIYREYKKIIVWGTGSMFFQCIKTIPMKIDYLIDNDASKWDCSIDGVKVYKPAQLLNEYPQDIVIIVCSMYVNEIKKQIKDMSINCKVISVLDIDIGLTYGKVSYSQLGEDCIVDSLLNNLSISNPSYLDIGANDPIVLSNTYLLYRKGYHGVCIEPDPMLFERLKDFRKRDTVLNIGIGVGHQLSTDFYIMTNKALNTFSLKEAEHLEKSCGEKIEQIVQIPLIDINSIIVEYFDKYPNFISIDVEGLELDILKMFNFDKYRPEVFCIETLTYEVNNSGRKLHEIIDYMESRGYFVFADTYINTIFVDKNSWLKKTN